MGLSQLLLGLFVLASAASLPHLLYLLVLSLAALGARRPQVNDDPGPAHQRFLVAIPAHDEEAGIVATVKSCLAQMYPPELFEVLVIADNCEDQTAELARREGATVFERAHPTDLSKGHALKSMFEHLAQTGQMDRLDAVVIIDADTVVDSDLLKGLSRYLDRGDDWIQVFDTVANSDDSWRTRLLAYSFGLINGVLLLGQSALGLSASFRGNGMCFSTRGLKRFPWRTFGLVEDLEYSWSLRIAGETIAFAPDVCVRATMLAEGGRAAAAQRRRWEFGRRELKTKMLGALLTTSRLGLTAKAVAVIELLMPTLVVLTSVSLASMLLAIGFTVTTPEWSRSRVFRSVLFLDALGFSGLVLYGMLPFFRFSLRWSVLGSLIHLPAYAIWKLKTALHGRPTEWIRTARVAADPSALSQKSGCRSSTTASSIPPPDPRRCEF
jgi:GT2 family glycosyltransferase